MREQRNQAIQTILDIINERKHWNELQWQLYHQAQEQLWWKAQDSKTLLLDRVELICRVEEVREQELEKLKPKRIRENV